VVVRKFGSEKGSKRLFASIVDCV